MLQVSSIAKALRPLSIAATALMVFLAVPALADGDVAKGEKLFKQCAACHAIANQASKIGPHLVQIIDRPIGSVEGYKYSPKLVGFSKTTPAWDEATLNAYLENPRKIIPGGKMAFGGLKKPEDRDNLIAFLKSK